MANVSAFSGQDVELILTFTVDGAVGSPITIRGFAGTSDAIKFEEAQEIVNAREGMDGYIFFARTGRLGGTMVLKMLPNSPSMAVLMTNAYHQKTGGKDVQVEGEILLKAQNVTADLKRGMMTHTPTFFTLGMSNIDDMQFGFYFTSIEAHLENADFDVFDANIGAPVPAGVI